MATQSPFSWLAHTLGALQPPAWMVDESLHRVVLFLNHVLMQEPEAMARLARQKGQRVQLQWQGHVFKLQPTAAGLLERADFEGFDLCLSVLDASVTEVASTLMRGEKPKVRIEGDVQLAAEINWLIDHVRWDAEEDLARLIGDAPAHLLAQAGRQAFEALRAFAGRRGDVAGVAS